MFLDNPDFGLDISPSELVITPELDLQRGKRIAVIRTSDRITFKRCRRAWGWGSHLKGNLGGTQAVSPLWLGSGFHFALEDYHGIRRYPSAADSFRAFVVASTRHGGDGALPPSWREDTELALGMLNYYTQDWLQHREPLRTFEYKGVPQVEVNFRILIPIDAQEWGFDEVVYSGTLDRVIQDDNDLLFIQDYKTAKSFETLHLETDPQVTAYSWAASCLYPDHPIGGFIYQQHKKSIPEPARFLANGGLSTAKNQATTFHEYRRAVVKLYGDPNHAPSAVIDTLNHFCKTEEPNKNDFIRRDRVTRNRAQCEAEGNKILLEVADMLNPQLDLYPNPTRDCKWCGFNNPCVALDRGEDWEYELKEFYKPRATVYDSWRQHLPSPEELTNANR